MTLDEFKEIIKILKNIKESVEIERFIMTASEKNAIEKAIEFLEQSIE